MKVKINNHPGKVYRPLTFSLIADYQVPFRLTGKIKKLTVKLGQINIQPLKRESALAELLATE